MISDIYTTNEPSEFCDTPWEIENYHKALNDQNEFWVCHHRRETDEGLTSEYLKSIGKYFHRPPEELIFLTRANHGKLHAKSVLKEMFVEKTQHTKKESKPSRKKCSRPSRPSRPSRLERKILQRAKAIKKLLETEKRTFIIDYLIDELAKIGELNFNL